MSEVGDAEIRAAADRAGRAIADLMVAVLSSRPKTTSPRQQDTGKPARTAWRPREVSKLTGISYNTVLELIHSGKLGAVKAGRMFVVPDAELDRFLTPGAPPLPAQPSEPAEVSVFGATPRSAKHHRNKASR